ncbi:MAG: metallophosphoesterase [Burkholderiales bacterium]
MSILRKLAFRHTVKLSQVLLCGVLYWGAPGTSEAIGQIGPACDPTKTTQTVSFVHVADLHARYGASFAHKWARMHRYYQDVLSVNPYTVFTNGGDDYEKGSVAEVLSAGEGSRQAGFAMGFDVRVLGNHDYAWGEQEVLKYSHDPKSIVVASNTVYTGNDPIGFGAVDYGELQVGCVKIGFFGFVSKPWNEFDTQYTGDFLPNFTQRWDWNARAREIIAAHRSSVDLIVMVSHLGISTDGKVVQYTPKASDSTTSNIDLVLGGHNHAGFKQSIVKKTLIIQPEFHGDGLTRVDLVWDIKNKRLVSRTPTPINVLTSTLTATNLSLEQTLQGIVTKYAPESEKQLALLESPRNYSELAVIAAQAGIDIHQADAALIDPTLTWVSGFSAGPVTQQMFDNLYRVERQKSGTPGFNGLYMATVSGADLTNMDQAQPGWVYVGPASPSSSTLYKVLLHKAPALNPSSFFPSNPTLTNVAWKSETWLALDNYARARTADCKYLDTDTTLPSCLPDTSITTIWNFDEQTQPFKTDSGGATVTYRDPANTGWGPTRTQFVSTGVPGLPNLPDGQSGVMAFPKTGPGEGYTITHNLPANGAFKASGLVSNYTLVMDVLWPSASDGVWRALMQTNPANSDDGDWFVKNAAGGGIGISQYFGSLQPNTWYRIAMVVNAQSSGGSLQFFINGTSVGTINSTGQRFALGSQVLVFADNDSETAAGYANAMLISDRSWTATEIAALGGPSALMALPSSSTLQAVLPTNSTLQTQLIAGSAKDIAKNKKDKKVRVPPATRKNTIKGTDEFDNKADKLKHQ